MINQEQRAYFLWDLLTQVASRREVITYGTAAEKIGIHHRAIRFVLAKIQEYCLVNNRPPLTILVVNQSGYPGSGFIAYDLDKFEEGKKKVFGEKWKLIENPFWFAKDGADIQPIVKSILKNKPLSDEQRALVKVRGSSQIIFRSVITKAYDNKCAICQIGIMNLLEAAHLRPWSESSVEERVSVNNGILLCQNHHALFDDGIIEIRKDFTIEVHYTKKRSVVDNEYLSSIENKKIALPKNIAHYPNSEYLL